MRGLARVGNCEPQRRGLESATEGRFVRNPMASARRKPKLKLFHAIVHVTRAEQWCVEAETEEEARALFAAGQGHRCDAGERLHVELDRIDPD